MPSFLLGWFEKYLRKNRILTLSRGFCSLVNSDFSWIICTLLRIFEHSVHIKPRISWIMNIIHIGYYSVMIEYFILLPSSFYHVWWYIYIFLFLDQKVTSFCEKNPKRANPFWSFVYCTYSPLILLLGISHCSMPIFGTPPSLHPVRKKRTTIRSLAASKDVQKTAPKLKSTHSSTATSTMYPRDQPQIW